MNESNGDGPSTALGEPDADGDDDRTADEKGARGADGDAGRTADGDDAPGTDGDAGRTADGDDAPGADGDGVCVAVVTIATDRSLESDAAGEAIVTALEGANHEVATREHVVSGHDRVQSIVTRMIDRDDVDVVITAGGTSIEPDDVTLEAVEPLLETELPPFGELFTRFAYEAIGTRAVAVRSLAGTADDKLVVCLPGTAESARLACDRLILPEVAHLTDLVAPPDADDEGGE